MDVWECRVDGCEHRQERGEDLLVHQATAHEPHPCEVCGTILPRGFFSIRHVFEEHGRTAFERTYDLTDDEIDEHETVLETVEHAVDIEVAAERIYAKRDDAEQYDADLTRADHSPAEQNATERRATGQRATDQNAAEQPATGRQIDERVADGRGEHEHEHGPAGGHEDMVRFEAFDAPHAETSSPQNRTNLLGFGVVSILLLLAEGLILFQYGNVGLVVHAVSIGVLVALVHRTDGQAARLFQSLLLLPLLRIFNLGLPFFTDEPLVFLGVIYVFLLTSTLIVVRSQDLSLADLGLTVMDARLVVPGLVIGLLFGFVQYSMGLEHIAYEPTLRNYVLLVLTAGLLVGLVEEVMFRGLVQRWAVDLLGQWPAIVSVSVLFGFMHSIWLTPMDMVFAGVVSVFLGWAYAQTNNMWFVTSVHGMINVSAFLLAPLYWSRIVDVLGSLPPIG